MELHRSRLTVSMFLMFAILILACHSSLVIACHSSNGQGAPPYTILLDTDGVADGNDPPMQGADFDGRAAVYIWPEDDIVEVKWMLDGRGVRVETSAPYSLAGNTSSGTLLETELLIGSQVRAAVFVNENQGTHALTATLAPVVEP